MGSGRAVRGVKGQGKHAEGLSRALVAWAPRMPPRPAPPKQATMHCRSAGATAPRSPQPSPMVTMSSSAQLQPRAHTPLPTLAPMDRRYQLNMGEPMMGRTAGGEEGKVEERRSGVAGKG